MMIANAYREMHHYLIERDASGLDEILDDNFEVVHETGMRQSKYDLIDCVMDGTFEFFHANHEDVFYSIQNGFAHITGKSVVEASFYGGDRELYNLCLDIDLAKNERYWSMTHMEVSSFNF